MGSLIAAQVAVLAIQARDPFPDLGVAFGQLRGEVSYLADAGTGGAGHDIPPGIDTSVEQEPKASPVCIDPGNDTPDARPGERGNRPAALC
ncbi:hypothetical protein ACTD5D_40975 [Nocardia takedensis]|uniref:hypothetical protein n=1 Tax=Nocardia takedensis TaxID=259390 RepID=UPI003F76E4FE